MTTLELKSEIMSLIGECTCHEAYTCRKLRDPSCHYHDYKDSIEDVFRRYEWRGEFSDFVDHFIENQVELDPKKTRAFYDSLYEDAPVQERKPLTPERVDELAIELLREEEEQMGRAFADEYVREPISGFADAIKRELEGS